MRVTVVGNTTLDELIFTTSEFSKRPQPSDSLHFARDHVSCLGGKGLITAVCLHKLGHSVRLITSVAASGESWTVTDLDAVHTLSILDHGHRSWILVTPEQAVHTTLFLGKEIHESNPSDIISDALHSCDAMYLSYEEESVVTSALDAALLTNVPMILNLNDGIMSQHWAQPDLIRQLLAASRAVLMNQAESDAALSLLGFTSWMDLRAVSTTDVVVTHGANGGYYLRGETGQAGFYPSTVPQREVCVVGAGDTFAGGFIDYFFEGGFDLEAACRRGAAVAADKVSKAGSTL